jgi:hypothetical protein
MKFSEDLILGLQSLLFVNALILKNTSLHIYLLTYMFMQKSKYKFYETPAIKLYNLA